MPPTPNASPPPSGADPRVTGAGAGAVEVDEAGALWRAMADDARRSERPVVAAGCDAMADRVDSGLDPVDRVAAAFDATLSAVGSLLDLPARADVLCELARGWDLAGAPEVATPLVESALEAVPGHLGSHLLLAHLRLPGPGYYELLDRLHEHLRPRSYLEIGMGDGSSMALARPGTRAVGVDPVPTLQTPIAAECLVVPQRSEDFFARKDVRQTVPGVPDLVFIDGLHTFTAALDDFIAVERLAGRHTVVAIHDTIPLDEPTQRPERVHAFYTGDVWKLLPTLWDVRPDLTVVTVRTSPSGLTLVTGLDPSNDALSRRRDQILREHGRLPFSMAASTRGSTLPDEWDAVRDHLSSTGVAGVRGPSHDSELASD